MAQKIEKWLASDGSEHPSQEAADAYDNDLLLSKNLSSFVDTLYGPDPGMGTPFKRLERDLLIVAMFRNRKVLMDLLLRHNAGPTLHRGNDATVTNTAGGKTGGSSGNAEVGVPPKPAEKPPAANPAADVPDNFLFKPKDAPAS